MIKGNNWEEVLLEDLCNITIGKTPPREDLSNFGGDNIWVSISDMDGKYVKDSKEKLTDKGVKENKARLIPQGTLLLSFKLSLGKVAITEKPIYTNEAIAALIPKRHFNPNYLYYYFKKYNFSIHGRKAVKGLCLNKKILSKIKVILPPPETQKKIVSILEKVEKAKKMRKEADELTKDYLNSVFLEMFGDLACNPKDFDIVKLETLMTKDKSGTKCGPFGSALKKNEYTEDGVPVLTMDNIRENEFVEEGSLHISIEKYKDLEPYSVENGDIIISRAGTVGKMCVVSTAIHPSIISTNLIRLSLDDSKIEPVFFTFLMTFFKGRVGRLRTGEDSAYTFMNTGILKELRLPLPPILFQRQFVDIFAKIKELKESQSYSHQKLDSLFNSLMQKAFKGELAC